jgi:hypothetical protein
MNELAKPSEIGRLQHYNAATELERSATQLAGFSELVTKTVLSEHDMERVMFLIEQQKLLMERHARMIFNASLASVQASLPSINQTGLMELRDKNGKLYQTTKFATIADIMDAVRPVLGEHGFSLMFKPDNMEDGRVKVVGYLRHAGGHEETASWILPQDSTGSKNTVQAMGSSQTYGRRYLTLSLLNISSRFKGDMDDDGAASSQTVDEEVQTISEAQVKELHDRMADAGVKLNQFLKAFGIDLMPDLPVARFKEACDRLSEAKNQREAKNAAKQNATQN